MEFEGRRLKFETRKPNIGNSKLNAKIEVRELRIVNPNSEFGNCNSERGARDPAADSRGGARAEAQCRSYVALGAR